MAQPARPLHLSLATEMTHTVGGSAGSYVLLLVPTQGLWHACAHMHTKEINNSEKLKIPSRVSGWSSGAGHVLSRHMVEGSVPGPEYKCKNHDNSHLCMKVSRKLQLTPQRQGGHSELCFP